MGGDKNPEDNVLCPGYWRLWDRTLHFIPKSNDNSEASGRTPIWEYIGATKDQETAGPLAVLLVPVQGSSQSQPHNLKGMGCWLMHDLANPAHTNIYIAYTDHVFFNLLKMIELVHSSSP